MLSLLVKMRVLFLGESSMHFDLNYLRFSDSVSKMTIWNKLIPICSGVVLSLLVANFAVAQEDEESDSPAVVESEEDETSFRGRW